MTTTLMTTFIFGASEIEIVCEKIKTLQTMQNDNQELIEKNKENIQSSEAGNFIGQLKNLLIQQGENFSMANLEKKIQITKTQLNEKFNELYPQLQLQSLDLNNLIIEKKKEIQKIEQDQKEFLEDFSDFADSEDDILHQNSQFNPKNMLNSLEEFVSQQEQLILNIQNLDNQQFEQIANQFIELLTFEKEYQTKLDLFNEKLEEFKKRLNDLNDKINNKAAYFIKTLTDTVYAFEQQKQEIDGFKKQNLEIMGLAQEINNQELFNHILDATQEITDIEQHINDTEAQLVQNKQQLINELTNFPVGIKEQIELLKKADGFINFQGYFNEQSKTINQNFQANQKNLEIFLENQKLEFDNIAKQEIDEEQIFTDLKIQANDKVKYKQYIEKAKKEVQGKKVTIDVLLQGKNTTIEQIKAINEKTKEINSIIISQTNTCKTDIQNKMNLLSSILFRGFAALGLLALFGTFSIAAFDAIREEKDQDEGEENF